MSSVVTNSHFRNLKSENGGGICFKSKNNLAVRFCFFTECCATNFGGGIYAECVSMSAFSVCFFRCCAAKFIVIGFFGNSSHSSYFDRLQASSCYGTTSNYDYGCMITFDGSSATLKNANGSLNSGNHIAGPYFRLNTASRLSYSIVSNNTALIHGVIIQFYSSMTSYMSYVIAVNNECLKDFAVVRVVTDKVYVDHSSFVGNAAPALYTGTAYFSYCYAYDNGDTKIGTIENRASTFINIAYKSFNCVFPTIRNYIINGVISYLVLYLLAVLSE